MKKKRGSKIKRKRNDKKFIFLALLLFLIYIVSVRVFPREYKDIVEKYSAEYNIDTSLIYAVISTESGFREKVESDAGAAGLMQITEDTGIFIARRLNIEDYERDYLFDPNLNIMMGTYYLMYLDGLFQNKDKMLAAYNAGPNRVKIWIDEGVFDDKISIPYGETRRYVKKVKIREKIYKILYFFDKG
ncbi:MAG: lytic transglycosylase domain-containing protein [Clostridium sp.]|nr:lytic transglycosylase domain-containing protein [Clostridium sp.]